MNESPFDVTETPVAAKTPPTEAPPADVLNHTCFDGTIKCKKKKSAKGCK